MADWTNKEILIPIIFLEDMYNRGLAYSNVNPQENEFKVYIDFENKNDWIMWSKVKELKNKLRKRVEKYRKENNNQRPQSIWVNKPKTTAIITKDPEWKKNKYIVQIAKIIGVWNTGPEFVEKIRAYAKKKGGMYQYYLNSRLEGTQKEINGLTNGLIGNCVDWSQLAYVVFKIMGFDVNYVQWQCKSVTHLTVEVKGIKTNNFDIVDLAAIVDSNSKYYEIGEHWCSNKRVSTNPDWMFEKGSAV